MPDIPPYRDRERERARCVRERTCCAFNKHCITLAKKKRKWREKDMGAVKGNKSE